MAGKTCVYIFLLAIHTGASTYQDAQSYGEYRLLYCNSKYLSHCNINTVPRVVDGLKRYFTNFTFITIVSIGNNLTLSGNIESQKGSWYKIEHKLCDYFRQTWLQAYLKLAHVSLPCPASPRTIHFNNLELPAPNIPIPMVKGTYRGDADVYTTVKKERVIKLVYTIHISDKFKHVRKIMNKNKKG